MPVFNSDTFLNFVILFSESFLESLCKLIRAGGFFEAALHAFKARNDLFCVHSFNELCNALGVAVAAAVEFYVFDLAVLNFKGKPSCTNACRLEFISHFYQSFLKIYPYFIIKGRYIQERGEKRREKLLKNFPFNGKLRVVNGKGEDTMTLFKRIAAFFVSTLLLFAGAIDNGGENLLGEARLISSDRYVLCNGDYLTQGITTDGEYFYCTGARTYTGFNGIAKISVQSGEVVLENRDAMPKEMKKQLFNHLGGCSYYNGKIYVAVEDMFRKHPAVAVFDAETLEFTGQYKILGEEIQPEGNLSWCAADKDKGVLYTGISRGGDFVNVLDAETLDFIERKPLETYFHRVQGAEVYDGILYISCNDTSKKKHVYAADPESGKVETVLERSAAKISTEAEGLTILPTEDGAFFHVVDVIGMTVGVIRHYSR